VSRITFNKTWYGSIHVNVFNKLAIYLGTKGGWGLGFEIDLKEKALTLDLIKFYIIFERFYDLSKLKDLMVDTDETQDKEESVE
jgi:hypothetical protein